jgi:hypothetical protein
MENHDTVVKIRAPLSQRRISHELVDLIPAYKSINVLYEEEMISITINNINFKISINYPFYPPDIFVNDRAYRYFIIPPSKRIDRLFKELNMCIKNNNRKCCLHCSSIIMNSSVMWQATYTIKLIMDEIEWIKETKQKIKYMLIVEMLFIYFGNKLRRHINIDRQVLEFLFDYEDGM